MNNKLIEELERCVSTTQPMFHHEHDTIEYIRHLLTRYKEQEQGDGFRESLNLPWHIGNTGTDQVMFLDKNDNYAGSVTIKQFQGRGAYDEPRRLNCANYILEACNNYRHQSNSEPLALDELAKRKGLELFARVELQNEEKHIGVDGDDLQDCEAKARQYLESLPDVKEERKI